MRFRLRILLLFSLIAFTGIVFAAGPSRVVELSAEERARLAHDRMLVERYLPNDAARATYQTVPGKLGTLRGIMKLEPLHTGRKDLMEALGVAMGDTFVLDMGFRWVAVEDDAGRRIAIRYRRSNVILYPLTMIAERIERGVKVDALDLYNEIAEEAEEKISAATR